MIVFLRPALTMNVKGNNTIVNNTLDDSPIDNNANNPENTKFDKNIILLITLFLRYKTLVSSVISTPLSKPNQLSKVLLFLNFDFKDNISPPYNIKL